MNTSYAEVWVEFLSSKEGGRATPVLLNDAAYRPHFLVEDKDPLGVEFVDGPDRPLPPGGSSFATVRFLYQPQVSYAALTIGASFDILEGPTKVGFGHVTRL